MDIVFATTSAVVAHPTTGLGIVVTQGQHWPADDPIVEAYPDHFTDDARHGLSSSRPLRADGYPEGYELDEDDLEPDGDGDTPPAPPATEQATAEPGTKRSRGRGASRS